MFKDKPVSFFSPQGNRLEDLFEPISAIKKMNGELKTCQLDSSSESSFDKSRVMNATQLQKFNNIAGNKQKREELNTVQKWFDRKPAQEFKLNRFKEKMSCTDKKPCFNCFFNAVQDEDGTLYECCKLRSSSLKVLYPPAIEDQKKQFSAAVIFTTLRAARENQHTVCTVQITRFLRQ